jgi:aerobic C4-dicarboxylate transport protein
VATLFIAHWDKTLDRDRARRVLRGDDVPPLHEIDEVPGETPAAPHIADTTPPAAPQSVAAAVPVGAKV